MCIELNCLCMQHKIQRAENEIPALLLLNATTSTIKIVINWSNVRMEEHLNNMINNGETRISDLMKTSCCRIITMTTIPEENKLVYFKVHVEST